VWLSYSKSCQANWILSPINSSVLPLHNVLLWIFPFVTHSWYFQMFNGLRSVLNQMPDCLTACFSYWTQFCHWIKIFMQDLYWNVFSSLFRVCLTVLSVAHCIEWLVIICKGYGRKWTWPNLRCYSDICQGYYGKPCKP
jgi:hypothetical protein